MSLIQLQHNQTVEKERINEGGGGGGGGNKTDGAGGTVNKTVDRTGGANIMQCSIFTTPAAICKLTKQHYLIV